MHIEVFGNGVDVSDVLRTYAESRVWLAARRAARRLSWIGVRLMPQEAHASHPRVVCQINAWLHGIGLVTVRHTDTNAYVGIDCAAVRLEQALIRRLRESGWYTRMPATRGGAHYRHQDRHPPRLAVVILPADSPPRLSLTPWLRARYGIEQVQNLTLSWVEWDALVTGDLASPHLTRFKERLALAQPGQPEAIVVVGGAVPQSSRDERPQARREIERVVDHVRSWNLPIEVIGVWVNEHWTSDDCLIESEELSLPRSNQRDRERDSEEELYAGLTSE